MREEEGAAPRASRMVMPAVYGVPSSEEGMLPWSHVEERLQRARNYWLATVRPDGRPHVTPVWGAWVDGALYIDGFPLTRWGRNIAANPAVSVHLESGDDVVILEGVVEDVVTDPDLARRIVDTWQAKYGRLLPEPDTSGVFGFRPRSARAWTTGEERGSTEVWADATRWEFPDMDP